MERVLQVLLQNRHLSLRMTADESAICKDAAWKTVVEGLQNESLLALCTVCIDCGTERYRLAACEDLIEKADSNTYLLKKIVIGDKSWCFAYDPEAKRQSSTWIGENSLRPHKLRFQKSRGNTTLVIFFGWQGAVHKEFVPEGQTVNFEFYKEVMDRLLKRLQRAGPDKVQSGRWFLKHNNPPSHNYRQAVSRK